MVARGAGRYVAHLDEAANGLPLDAAEHLHLQHAGGVARRCGAQGRECRKGGIQVALRRGHGGGQEREIRSGTLNAPSIVAFAVAAKEIYPSADVQQLRDNFIQAVKASIPDAYINGESSQRLPGIVNVTFPGTQSDTLLLLLDNAHVFIPR